MTGAPHGTSVPRAIARSNHLPRKATMGRFGWVAMSGRRSRSKGARGEREAADFYRPIWPECSRRPCGGESQRDQGRDLDATPGFSVQVKTMARPNPLAALAEAIAAAREGEIPLAHCRRVRSGHPDGEEPTVMLRATDARWLIHVFNKVRAVMPARVDELRRECEAADPNAGGAM